MNFRFLFALLGLGLSLLAYNQFENVPIEELNSNEIKPVPAISNNANWSFYLPKSTTAQIIKHKYYTLSYHEKAEQAEWVAYELKKDYVKNSNFKRPYFIEDPKVTTQSADWRNYKKSGFDKGHLCPAADMEFDINAYNDTFLPRILVRKIMNSIAVFGIVWNKKFAFGPLKMMV